MFSYDFFQLLTYLLGFFSRKSSAADCSNSLKICRMRRSLLARQYQHRLSFLLTAALVQPRQLVVQPEYEFGYTKS